MKYDAPFIALGGAQRVGSSCYFLRFGGAGILLDTGGSFDHGVLVSPRFTELLGSPFLESMNQISHIFISHAHNDHVASLLPILQECPHAQVYMTDLTWRLVSLQMERQSRSSSLPGESDVLVRQRQLDRTTRVTFMQTIDLGGFRATFLPAGHIPGAMMVLLDDGHRKVLYTGDYAVEDTPLTGACYIPDGLKIDTMIMCALHARHSSYSWNSNDLYRSIRRVFRTVMEQRVNVVCRTNQLSKGVELLAAMNAMNTGHVPIRIAPSVMEMVELLERSGSPILTRDNFDSRAPAPQERYVFLTADSGPAAGMMTVEQRIDFSLHDDFAGMKQLIRRVEPRQAVMVHCAPFRNAFDSTIEQAILEDPTCRTQFLFPEEGTVYMI